MLELQRRLSTRTVKSIATDETDADTVPAAIGGDTARSHLPDDPPSVRKKRALFRSDKQPQSLRCQLAKKGGKYSTHEIPCTHRSPRGFAASRRLRVQVCYHNDDNRVQ